MSTQARYISLLAESLHLTEGRGLTVGDLQAIGFKQDNAEKRFKLKKWIASDAWRNNKTITSIFYCIVYIGCLTVYTGAQFEYHKHRK